MRNIPLALQSHIEQEVTTLARCLSIKRTDGIIYRLTTHDQPIVVNGDTYRSDIALTISALESSDSLEADNAEIEVGISNDGISLIDLEGGDFDNATFSLFIVNWDDPLDGVIALKSGTLGDIEIVDDLSAKIQLRGLTYFLQKPIVERYSLTCRAVLGDKRCGYVNTPNKVRTNNQLIKTYDWFLVPNNNVESITLSNVSFESALSGNWQTTTWSVSSSITPYNGTQYAVSGSGTIGEEQVIYQDIAVSSTTIDEADIDSGLISVQFVAQVTSSSAIVNPAKLFLEQYDASGDTLRRDETAWIMPIHETWQGVDIVSSLLPLCRSFRVGAVSRLVESTAGNTCIDSTECRFWLNQLDTWGGAAFRTVKLPSYANDELVQHTNLSFEADGQVGNGVSGITGWDAGAGNYWRVVSAVGALSPNGGSVFLFGGDSGTTTPNSVYVLSQSIVTPHVTDGIFATRAEALAHIASLKVFDAATLENINAGWYSCSVKFDIAVTDATSAGGIVVNFFDRHDTLLDSVNTGYISGMPLNTWFTYTFVRRVPANTAKIITAVVARSNASGSAANVGFDNVGVYAYPVAYEHEDDAETGYLSPSAPTYDYTELNFTQDGSAIVQAKPLNFSYHSVTAVTDSRTFSASTVSASSGELYSGRITWLSGENAGKSSYIRVWSDSSRQFKVYTPLKYVPQVGDYFILSNGCNKTIDTCSGTFGNAHNFRGEPYIPGPANVIQFLTAEA